MPNHEIPGGPTEVHQDQDSQIGKSNLMGREFAPQPEHFSIRKRRLPITPSELPYGIAPAPHVPYLFSPEYDEMRLKTGAQAEIDEPKTTQPEIQPDSVKQSFD